ncbi:MAG: threonine--tRNA ligase [Polyangiales bacterium]
MASPENKPTHRERLTLRQQASSWCSCNGTSRSRRRRRPQLAGASSCVRESNTNKEPRDPPTSAGSSFLELASVGASHAEAVMEDWDHRSIGARMELFHLQEEAPGLVFWHARGWSLWRRLEDFLRKKMRRAGYHEVKTPQLLDRSIWEASGHWENFSESMFKLPSDDRVYGLKPVSCPAHVQIWKRGIRSFRELPLRLSEFGACHRYERSGVLQGLLRVRGFVQDDGHVFCAEPQVEDEIARACALLRDVYASFGFDDVAVKLSTRPPVRAGSDEVWDRAESQLAAAARSARLDYEVQPGEGAFYGPKIEMVLRDGHGRSWQCGTIQLDLVIPERMGVDYVDAGGARRRPAMIHRAVCGSLERFIAILLEHHRGDLPPWLAPESVVVAPVSEGQIEAAQAFTDRLLDDGMEARIDARAETLARRMVDQRRLGVPFSCVIGAREAESGAVSLNREVLSIDAAIARLRGALSPPA